MADVELHSRDLGEFTEELGAKIQKFNKCFDDLESEINRLTSAPFMGEASEALNNHFKTKLKPNLDQIVSETKKAEDYMAYKTEGFEKLSKALEDTMRA